jgi:hypothetical protein
MKKGHRRTHSETITVSNSHSYNYMNNMNSMHSNNKYLN